LHPLSSVDLSFDSNTVADFQLTGNIALLDTLFSGRAHISDFVEEELKQAHIKWPTPKVLALNEGSDLQLFAEIGRNNPSLAQSEVGAITVAFVHGMTLFSNDRATRQTATELGLAVFGSVAILRYGVDSGIINQSDAINILCQIVAAGPYCSDELADSLKQDVLKEVPKER